jgi:hypothetical protein
LVPVVACEAFGSGSFFVKKKSMVSPKLVDEVFDITDEVWLLSAVTRWDGKASIERVLRAGILGLNEEGYFGVSFRKRKIV